MTKRYRGRAVKGESTADSQESSILPTPSPTQEYSQLLRQEVNVFQQKKGKRKVQGVPQSQTAALPRPQEEEEFWYEYMKYSTAF